MAKLHQVAFEIAGRVNASFIKSFGSAGTEMQRLSQQIARLSSTNTTINKFQALENETQQLQAKWVKATITAKQLTQEMSKVQNPTKAMQREFTKAESTAQALQQKLEQKRQTLVDTRKSLLEAGVATNTLAASQARLTRQSELAQNAQKMLGNAAKFREGLVSKQQQIAASQSNTRGQIFDTVALAASFTAPIRAAMAFESQMADVRKVVDFPTPEAFQGMSNELLNMSTRIPIAADGLAQIAAAAGQSGIPLKDIANFTQDAAKMGVAFDITADQAGDMMAKWRTAFKMNQTEVVSLADKINYLSNVTAASSGDISEVVTRVGALGEVAGVSAGSVAAIGATMASVGVQSEVAATGVQNMMLGLTAGDKATKSQLIAFEKLHLSATQISKSMQTDSKGTILDVFSRIGKLSKDQQASVLTGLFGKESIKAIASMLTILDQLKINFDRVGDANQYAGSMQGEYTTRSQTTANSLQLFKNSINATAVAIGSSLLPAVNQMLLSINQFINETVRPFIEQHKEEIIVLAKAAAACLAVNGAMLILKFTFGWFVGGGLSMLIGSMNTFGRVLGWFVMPILTRTSLGMKLMAAAQAALNFVMNMNPFVRVAMLLIALGGAVYWVATHWDEFKIKVSELWEYLKGFFGFLGEVVNAVKSLFDKDKGKYTVDINKQINNSNQLQHNINDLASQKAQMSYSKPIVNNTNTFSPNVVIEGSADKQTIEKALKQSNVDFNKQQREWAAQQARLAYK